MCTPAVHKELCVVESSGQAVEGTGPSQRVEENGLQTGLNDKSENGHSL